MSVTPNSRRELATLVNSRIPLIVIETRDEPRVLEMLAELATELARPAHTPVFRWTATDGMRRVDVDLGGSQMHNSEPTEVLRAIRATERAGLYVLVDFHPFLGDPMHVRLIKDICLGYERVPRTLVLVSHELVLPRELEHLAARFELAFPTRNEREAIVRRVVQEWRLRNAQSPEVDEKALGMLVENLAGLSIGDTERLARQAILDDGTLAVSDLPAIMEAKYALLNRNGVLAYEYDTARYADVGGLRRIKEWLMQRRSAFDGSKTALDSPKGVLLLGVQGCGKSLAARAAAGVFGVPLLRLDFGALYNKYHGESERNLRDSLRTAEVMAPCVLWIDEVEKGLASDDGDSGTSRRVLGSFLTWLAEKRAAVFVVATANDISALPPELVRKGRFDEIFFVDLPRDAVRTEILRIHAAKRQLAIGEAEIRALAHAADGFSGGEIEQAVVSALYVANAAGEPPSARHVLTELKATRPLSVVMAERVVALREWAAGRTVPAD
jgi:SpoVK/Ycf46/Vps4 family AAA+-type ATPase